MFVTRRFENNAGTKVNLVLEFVVTMWLKYISLMTGKPEATMNSAQLVLKYLVLNQKKVHRAWRNRIYRFSSGTTFGCYSDALIDYLEQHGALKLRAVSNMFANLCKMYVYVLLQILYRLVQNACLHTMFTDGPC